MWLCICSGSPFEETFENTHRGKITQKSCFSAVNATMHILRQENWRIEWKYTLRGNSKCPTSMKDILWNHALKQTKRSKWTLCLRFQNKFTSYFLPNIFGPVTFLICAFNALLPARPNIFRKPLFSPIVFTDSQSLKGSKSAWVVDGGEHSILNCFIFEVGKNQAYFVQNMLSCMLCQPHIYRFTSVQ